MSYESVSSPSMLQQATTHNWLSSVSVYNILKPVVDPNIVKRWGNQDITGMFDMVAGGKNPVAALIYRHYEEDRLHSTITVDSDAGGAQTRTLTAATAGFYNNFPTSAYSPYLTTGTQVDLLPVRAGDTVIYPDNTRATVSSVNQAAHTFVVTADANSSLPALAQDDELIILGVTVGEEASSPESLNNTLTVYSNVMQIMADAYKTSGSAMGEQVWVKDPGTGKYLWYFKGQADTKKNFENNREVNLVAGKKVEASSATVTANPTLLKTEGLFTFAEAYGNNLPYNIIPGLTKDDFDTLVIDMLDKNAGAVENSIWSSIKLRRGINNFISPEMKNGGVQYGAFKGGEKQYVNFDFESFTTLGYTFHAKTYQLLNNPTYLGATGHSYENFGVLVPLSQDMYRVGDMKEKVTVPSVRMNYVSQTPAGGTYSRDMEEWITGGANGVYTETTDRLQINFRSHFGFEGFGANRFAIIEGQ